MRWPNYTLCAVLTGFAAVAAAAPPDFSGVWEMRFREYIRQDDGKLPPMRPAALARYNERVAALQAGHQVPDSTMACLPHGVPRLMYTPYPMQIAQRPDVVIMLFEVNHNIRLAYLNEKPPVDPDPAWLGYSVAHWEGQTLVVETNGLNDKIQIDRAGLPQGLATRITERMNVVDGGTKLINRITVDDDTLYYMPWTFTVEYKKVDYKLTEYVCENNRMPPSKSNPR